MSFGHPLTPRSRFQEGSMNDRTSAVPPPRFLGPDAHSMSSASLPNFHYYEDDVDVDVDVDMDMPAPPPPAPFPPLSRGRAGPEEAAEERAQSASIAERRGLTGLWEGLRERIWGRKRPVSLDGAAVAAAAARRVGEEGPRVGPAGPARPTREELLASYNELAEAGFFRARAIQGSRQPPPGATRPATSGGGGSGDGRAYVKPRLETIYSPTRAAPAAPAQTEGRTATPSSAAATPECAAGSGTTTPDSRGRKRAHEADADGAAGAGAEGGEKTVRKLRRTTRSITELHARLRRAREELRPPVSYAEPGKGPSGGGGIVGAVIRRSASGNKLSKKFARPVAAEAGVEGGGEGPRVSAPVTPVMRLGPVTFDATRAEGGGGGGGPGLRRVQGDEALRVLTAGSAPPRRVGDGGARQAPPAPAAASANWVAHPGPGQTAKSSPGQQQGVRGPPTRRRSQQRNAQLQAQRMAARRKGPLSVVPDAGRGIPNVPAIPARYKYPAGAVMGGGVSFYREGSFAGDALLS